MFESFSEIEETEKTQVTEVEKDTTVVKKTGDEEDTTVVKKTEVEEDKTVVKKTEDEEVQTSSNSENVVSSQAIIVVGVYALALLCVLMYNDVTSPMVTLIALFIIVGASLMLDAQMATITTAITAIAAVLLFYLTPAKPSFA